MRNPCLNLPNLLQKIVFDHILNKTKRNSISLLLVVIIGLTLSFTAFFYIKQWEYQQTIDSQQKQANNHVRTLRQSLTSFGSTLHSIGALYRVRNQFTRQDFSQFVRRDLLAQSGIQALEWIPKVPFSQRAQIETTTRLEGIHGFGFWDLSPSGERRISSPRKIHYPILFTEPLNSNARWVGYDLAADDILKQALEKAGNSGQLTSTEGFYMPIDAQQTLVFRVLVPVYSGDSDTILTLEQRQQNLVGFASGVFSFESLAHTVLRLPKFKNTEVFLRILDQTPQTEIKNLYAPIWYEPSMEAEIEQLLSVPLEFGGRNWTITFSITSDGQMDYPIYALTVLSLGILFTLLLWRYLFLTLTRVQWAENLVKSRTESLEIANEALNKEIGERERMTKALEISRQRFEAIFNEAPIGIVQSDLQNRILDNNRALQTLFRYREDELQGRELNELAHPEDRALDLPLLKQLLEGKYDSYRIGKRYICKNGSVIWATQSCSIVRDLNQPFIISMIEDISERKLAEEGRLDAEKKYRDIFENAIEGIFQCTPDNQFLSVNPAFVRMFGYDSAEQLYQEVSDIGQQLFVNAGVRTEYLRLLEVYSELKGFEYEARCRNGSIIWVNETARVVKNERGQIRYYEGIVEDVTQRKHAEDKLRYDASHDQLTGLFNRTAFTSQLTVAILRVKHNTTGALSELGEEERKIDFAVLFVDLDRFKLVNDSMGHLMGDRLLREIGHRLHYQSCSQDLVARFGGDEFALMLENLCNLSALEQRIEDIQRNLSEPYYLEKEVFNTTASIGIALSTLGYDSADEVLRDADTAMYEAKKQGRGKAVIFQPGMHAHVVNTLRMETDLRKALDRNEFSVYYQPIVSLDTFYTVGLEALVRWHHPEHGLIRPDLFIPLAEETGLIRELGLWVLETACSQLRCWQTQFLHHASLGMNINMSPVQLKQPYLVRKVQDILEKTGIHGPDCRIEITESAMMQDPEAALNVLNGLKDLEVLLYIDDFGTGYSSLSYLQKFPIDALKIDKSFIKDVDSSPKSAQIVQAIIALGTAFDLRIVAEGVENSHQMDLLKQAHCHHVQGYLFSRPQDRQTTEHYLSAQTHRIV